MNTMKLKSMAAGGEDPAMQAPRDSLRHLHLTRWAAGFEKLRESSATRTKALCTRMAARAIV